MEKIYKNPIKIAILFCVVFFLAYSIYSIFFSHVAMEETAYVYAGKLVLQGKTPYTDFFYPQAPLLPFVYANFQLFFGSFLLTGRFVSFLFSILIFFLIYKIAKNKSGLLAALIALLIFISNVFTLTKYTAVLVYALTSFFIVLSIFFASRKLTKKVIFFSLLLMAAAVATRISILPAFIVLSVYFLILAHKKKKVIFVLIASLFSIIIFFLPFALKSFDHLFFDTITYQLKTTQYYTIFEDISAFRWNLRKILLISGLIENFFSAIVLGGIITIYYLSRLVWFLRQKNQYIHQKTSGLTTFRLSKRSDTEVAMPAVILFIRKNHFEILLLFLALGLFAAHLLPNRPYSVYFTPIVPLIAILGGIVFSKIFSETKDIKIKTGFAAFFIIVIVLSLLLVSERTILNVNPFKTIKEASEFIKKNSNGNDKVLTLEVLPALEAQHDLLPFTERGNYLYFPTLPKEMVQKYKLLNSETLISYIKSREAGVITLSSRYFFQKRVTDAKEGFKAIKKALDENYYQAKVIENYAGNWGKLYIYLPIKK